MDGHQNQQQHYAMNFGGMADHQQQTQLQLQQQQARLQQQQQQQQEYSQLFFNQQNYLNMPIIYNSTQNLQQQSIDMQALQRQQQLLQALTPQHQLQAVQQQQHHIQQQPVQQQLILDQNITSQNPMSQHLQQQLYASSVQQFQANLQHQQPSSHLEHLAALQNGAHLLHSSSQTQHQTPVQQQQQQHFYQKPNDYLISQTPSLGAGSALLAQHQQLHHHQQVLRQQQPQQILSTPHHGIQQEAQMPAHQQQLKRKSREETPNMKSPSLKSPVVNANAENARILKEREEEVLAHKKEEEVKEKQRIQEELKRNKEVAKEFADTLSERIRSFPEPLHLATCHTLSKVSAFMPFPSECAATSSSLPCFDSHRAQTVLSNVDVSLAQYLSSILAETAEEIRDIELKHDEEESNELENNLLTPLVQSVLSFNQDAYHVDFQSEWSEIEQAFGKDIQEAVARVTAEEDAALAEVFTQQHHHSHVPSTTISINVASEASPSVASTSHTPLADCQADNMSEASQQIGRDQTQLRKQMVSVGKQPKAASGRRKRDMVESLYDSLTGYFDPSKDRRRRRGGRGVNSDDEDSESLVDRNEEQNEQSSSNKTEPVAPHKTVDLNEESVGKFFEKKRKRQRKPSDADENRPTTPTEIIHQRELEWHERQRQRQEKFKRRQTEADLDCWNNEVMAENESFCKFTNIIDQILEQVEDFDIVQNEAGVDINQELLIDRSLLDELRMEAQKLKSWRKINKVNSDRLIKVLMVLERNIRDVLNDEGALQVPVGYHDDEDESDETYRELMDERLIRSADAACTALTIMTSPKMPKQILIEDAIERSIQVCKQYLQHVVYPAADSSMKSPTKSKKSGDGAKRRKLVESFSPTTSVLYSRIVDMIGGFSELARFHSLNDTVTIQLCSLATPPFFVDNIPEIQVQSIKLLSTIFNKCSFLRKHIIDDLLNSLHRLPSSRNQRNCYRLANNDYINNFTVLILQLLQSTVKLPFQNKKGSHGGDDSTIMGDESFSEDTQAGDRLVVESYKDAESLAKYFFYHFLTRCTAKSEDDFRRLFEQFLQEILLALYRPEWPVAELVLSVLGSLLVMFFRNQNVRGSQETSKSQANKGGADSSFVVLPSLRVASLDYLGTIAARLRKDRVSAIGSSGGENSENNRLDLVVRGIIYDELNDMSKTLDEVNINHLSSTEKLRKLEQALIDYIIGTKGESDVSVEYVVTFYAAEWYRMTVLDVNAMKQKYQEDLKQQMTQKEAAKIEKKLERIMEKGANMKEFIRNLMDKKHLKKRTQYIAKTGNVMIDSDAYWVVKYLASKKELSQSFDYYLNNILEGFNPIFPVAIRTKAMKCLSQLVEADHQVLVIPDVNKIVQDRLIDPNAAVREATFELIGKYLVSRPDLVDTYYSILVNRIKDSAIAVRKRVIRILRDVIEKQPKLDKKAEILARIINRINDEDGVKKLCIETFQNLWFLPNRDIEKKELEEKIASMADTATVCLKENMVEQFEQLVCAILTNCQEKVTIYAAKQVVDALVDCVISLNLQIAKDDGSAEEVGQAQLIAKRRLNASLATLSVFAKARPELLVGHADVFVPYVLWSKDSPDSTPTELRVLNQMIAMLERIVPLMEHPSENFLANLDSRLNVVVSNISSMVIISTSISCMSAIYEKFQRVKPGICDLFLKYLNILSKIQENPESMKVNQKPAIMRAIYTLGLMCRFFNFDELLTGSPKFFELKNANTTVSSVHLFGAVDNSEVEKSPPVFRDKVFSILLFFSRSKEEGIRTKALIALGQYSSGCPELLNKAELKNMYTCLLKSDHKDFLMLKVQVLKNLSYFLSAEEERALKKNIQFRKEKEENKEADLKEMELSSSGLSSSVIQDYWLAILSCYINKEDNVRTEAAQVIWQTLEQGLVTPGSSIPTLMAMSTDPLPVVRIKIENLIKDIDTKYSGMVAAKTTPGVQVSLRLQREISRSSGKIIRGIRLAAESVLGMNDKTGLPKMSNDAQSLLSGLYVGIRTNRQQRRSFLAAMLRFFEENAKLEVEDWIFVADNLAHFPYQLMDEPLYVIHTANSIIDIAGQNILSSFKHLLAPRKRYGRSISTPSSSAENLDETADEDDLTAEAIYTRFPNDKTPIYELKKNSQACFILLHLKFFLIKMYGFKEDKIKEYSPMHAAKTYDKPMTRKNVSSFSPDSIIRELRPEAIAAQDTIEGHMKLAEHFYNFNKMLLSLNKQDEDDDEDAELTTTIADPTDPAEEESNDGSVVGRSTGTRTVRSIRNCPGDSEIDSDGD